MNTIKVALVGVGNCASSLVQGRYYYADGRPPAGLMHERIGGYAIADIEFVLAFDIDARKVGKDLGEAIFAKPNCTTVFHAGRAQDRRRRADGPGARRHGAAYGRGRRARLRPLRRARSERGRDRRRAQGVGRRGAGQLSAGRLGGGDPLLHGMRAEGRASRWSIACRCSSPATPNGSGASARRGCRSSATTSRRSWARPSSTACSPACSGRAASRSTAPISSTPAAIPTS